MATPSADQLQRLNDTKGLFWRTCDQCSATGICLIVDGQFYICEDCQAYHERALDAARLAIRETGLVPKMPDNGIDVLAWAAIKAYVEYSGG